MSNKDSKLQNLASLTANTNKSLQKLRNLIHDDFADCLDFIGLDEYEAMNGLQGMDYAIFLLNKIQEDLNLQRGKKMTDKNETIFYWGLKDKTPYLKIFTPLEDIKKDPLTKEEMSTCLTDLIKRPYVVKQDDSIPRIDKAKNIISVEETLKELKKNKRRRVEELFENHDKIYLSTVIKIIENSVMRSVFFTNLLMDLSR